MSVFGKQKSGGSGTPTSISSDTTVSVNNASSQPVNGLELVTSLTTSTAGSETSQVVAKVLSAGSPVNGQTIGPGATLFPAGTTSAPGVSFSGHTGNGMLVDGSSRTVIQSSSTVQLYIDGTNGLGLLFPNTASKLYLNATALDAGLSRSTTDGSLQLLGPASTFGVWTTRRLQTSKGSDVASATTITLGDGNYFAITGTTTINGIVTTSWQSGTKVCLQLPSGITITNNSGAPGSNAVAILLRAGSNLTTTGVYYLELWYNGANWVQPS